MTNAICTSSSSSTTLCWATKQPHTMTFTLLLWSGVAYVTVGLLLWFAFIGVTTSEKTSFAEFVVVTLLWPVFLSFFCCNGGERDGDDG